MQFKFYWTAFLLLFLIMVPLQGQTTVKILPLGNSMTEGWIDGTQTDGQKKGFRYDLKLLLNAAGYSTDFVGSKSTGCDYFTDCQNGGISGTRDQYLETMLITGYDQRWGIQETPGPYLDAFNPDVIMLNVGTNDITHETNAIDNQRVSAILDQIDAYEARSGKQVMVFLDLIINRRKNPDGTEPLNFYTTSQWNLAIKAMAQQRIANGDKIVIVDMEHDAGFSYAYNGGDMSTTDPEGLHPTTTGYTKMANLLYQKFIANYNMAPVISPILNQTVAEGNTFTTIQLDNYVSDVEDADQYITWTTSQISTSYLNVTITNRQALITPKDANWTGSQSVIFTATDRGISGINIKSDADTVVFTVTPVNDAPVITGQAALSMTEDSNLELTLANFTISDPDSDPSTFQLVVLPGTNYTTAGNTVIPVSNYYGSLGVNVAVSDDFSQGPTYSATITVNGVNDPPVFISQPEIIIDEDNLYPVDVQNFNVTDADNTKAQLTLVMQPGANYTIEGATIRPDANFNGTLYVESYIRDPQGAMSVTFYMQILVNPVNDAPVFTSIPADTATVNAQYIYSIKVFDPDVEDILAYSVFLKPAWLTFYPNSRLLAGIPHPGDPGNSGVSIRVSDGHADADQSFVIHVDGTTPVPETETGSQVYLYPNPAQDFISLKPDNRTEELTFDLYDLSGKPLLHKVFCRDCESVINLRDYSIEAGSYIYRIKSVQKTITGKLLITEP